MNQSPNLLHDQIALAESDIGEILITEVNNTYYVMDRTISRFIEENAISDQNNLMDYIKEANSLNNLTILSRDDNTTLYEVMLLAEALNPIEIKNVAKNKRNLSSYMSQAKAFIKKQEYDKESDVVARIQKCDKLLADIEDEKKAATLRAAGERKEYKTSAVRFTAYYLFNIAKTIFTTFVLPGIVENESIPWPSFINSIFEIDRGYKGFMSSNKALSIVDKIASLSTAATKALQISKDARHAFMSVADYTKLLDEYSRQITDVRHDLSYKLEKIQKDKVKVEV